MSQAAKDYAASLRPSTQENSGKIIQEYEEWMERLEHESQTPSADIMPSKMDERKDVVQPGSASNRFHNSPIDLDEPCARVRF